MDKKYNFFLCIVLLVVFLLSCSNTDAPYPQKPVSEQEKLSTREPEPVPAPNPAPTPKSEPWIEVGGVIGSYKTTITDKSEERVHNIVLASKLINGYVIQPNGIFSFNEGVGERRADRGFLVATVIEGNDKAYDEGGGICQVSSTLFNTAAQAGMEIIERHPHTKNIRYLPKGKDAAVAYGKIDFRFKNTKPFPIKINTYVEGDKMIAVILRAE